jgi:peptide/nickel transport system substrate-binding protein/oligopeptide transport system substrate-binding protein
MTWSYRTKLAASIAIAAALIGGALSGITPGAQAAPTAVTIPEPLNQPMSTLDPTQWAAQILIDQGTVMEGLYGYNDKDQLEP